eukprot:GHUV01039415.1.p1 GENE.GHUV01039415.1~~GHUV01039415.1.p1  ORF type:complete len:290 (+),score=75.10 GHUV01039415.1:1376-2245(+)
MHPQQRQQRMCSGVVMQLSTQHSNCSSGWKLAPMLCAVLCLAVACCKRRSSTRTQKGNMKEPFKVNATQCMPIAAQQQAVQLQSPVTPGSCFLEQHRTNSKQCCFTRLSFASTATAVDVTLAWYTAGVGGNKEPDPVEYDLDNEDEDWLKTYNLGRSRLNDVLFEKMLYKLELACAEATDNALSAAGAGPAERTAASAVAAIDHLPRHDAVRILVYECGGREKICQDVYNYWASKRKKWGKPIMRRLQAPTPCSDTNPYNTFRYVGGRLALGLFVLMCDRPVLFAARCQ